MRKDSRYMEMYFLYDEEKDVDKETWDLIQREVDCKQKRCTTT